MFTLVNLGITICTTADGHTCRRGSDVTAFILPLIKMQGAYDDNRNRAKRIKDGLDDKRSKVSRDAPLTGRVPAWLVVIDTKTGNVIVSRRIEEIPEHADIVRRIFEMAAAGWGAGAIAGKLNTEGVPTFHADPHRKWHKSYVAKVLNNRAVLGELQMFESERLDGRRTRHKLGDPVPAYFPVTVQFDLWRRAQAAIASRTVKRSGRPSREGVNLFSGMCKCGACGGSMELRGKGERKGGDYLTCANRLRKAGCSASRNYPLGKLETTFFNHWSGLFGREADFATGNTDTAEAAARIDRAEQEIRITRQRLDNLTDALSEAESGDERRPIRAKVAATQAALDNLADTRADLVRELEVSQATVSQASRDEMERITQRALLSKDASARRKLSQVLRETVQRIDFDADRAVFSPVRGSGQFIVTFVNGGDPTVKFERDWAIRPAPSPR